MRLGIGRTFQNIRLFTRLTVFSNVWVAQRAGDGRRGPRAEHRRVEELLAFHALATSGTNSPGI